MSNKSFTNTPSTLDIKLLGVNIFMGLRMDRISAKTFYPFSGLAGYPVSLLPLNNKANYLAQHSVYLIWLGMDQIFNQFSA